MTLGQLADMLQEMADAESDISERQRALGYGGSEHTMAWKTQALQDAIQRLEMLRNQEVTLC